MKKLFTLLTIALLGISTTIVNAQTTTTKKEKAKTETTVHLKKDGSPDKRFKENKTTTVHLKKDGTPDMRYKDNKKTTTKTVVKKK